MAFEPAKTRAERRAAQLAMLTAALGSAHQVAAKSLREGLFLSTFAVSALPKAMLAAALASIPLALLVARAMSRFGPARVAPTLFVVSALLSILEWFALPSAPRAAAAVVYLHVSLGGALLMSSFWSLANECFDPHSLKQSVGRIGASATLGGLLGGAAVERFAHYFDPRSALLLIASMALTAAFSNRSLARTQPYAPQAKPEVAAEARVTGYLFTLALLVACGAAASALGDFALKRVAAQHLASASSCVRFFAAFYTGASLVSFVLQVAVSRRLLATIGIGGTLSVLPLSGVLLGAVSASAPSFALIGALRAVDSSFGPSLFRSAFEPLFAPVSAAARRKTKALIDVVFDKAGDAFAALCAMLLTLAPRLLERGLLLLATALSALMFVLALRAWRGYVAELEANLRAGAERLESADAPPVNLRMTLSVSAFDSSANVLAPQLVRFRAAVAEARDGSKHRASADAARADSVLADARVLLGRDEEAIRSVLTRPKLDASLISFIVPHLANDALAKTTVLALRELAANSSGLLCDFMLSSAQPLAIRRRIPHVLRALRGEAVARALTAALESEALEVRHRSALALLDVTANDRALLPERRRVMALALSEARRTPLVPESVDHLFSLLALSFPREPLELSRHALRTDDRKLRGIALEYLESLLPEAVRAPLLNALKQGVEHTARGVRTEAQLRDALRRSIGAAVSPLCLAGEPD